MPSSPICRALFSHNSPLFVHSQPAFGWRGLELLRFVACRRDGCSRGVVLCRGCYRGQRYCSHECRRLVRREQCRRAQKRYSQTLAGRLKRAALAASYRERKKKGQTKGNPKPKIVIDQTLSSKKVPDYSNLTKARCARCGCMGKIFRPPS
jgi:hypothetical protein